MSGLVVIILIVSAEHIFRDYQFSKNQEILLPEE